MPQVVSWKATKLQTGSSDPQPKGPGKDRKLMRLQSYIQLSLVPYHLYPMILEPYLQGRYIGYMKDAKKSSANGREYSYVDVLIAFVKGLNWK